MNEADVSYFSKRAEVELDQAQRALRPEVASVHLRLAQAYRDRVAQLARTQPANLPSTG